ncbi:MAG TPA: PAS domain-containing protein, partial [Planctomycetia bacterium]|nr:PAS domain-containing protein [Planctomycetia bacterium]
MFAQLWQTIQGRLAILGVIASAALLGAGWFARTTVEAVKINGDAYRRIDSQRQLLSDLMPASLNVVRAKLAVNGVDPGARPEVIASVVEDYNREKEAFFKALARWQEVLPEGAERNRLVDQVGKPGKAFFDVADRELFPALRGGAKEKAKVDKLVEETLGGLQKQQSEAIVEMVKSTEGRLAAEERAAAELVESRRWFMIVVIVAAVAFVLTSVAAVIRGVRRQAEETIATVRAVAAGDYQRRMAEGVSEFGRIGSDVNAMTEMLRQVAEINKSQAIIEFCPEGQIMAANDRFLQTMGYTLSEIVGQHHRMFADSAFAASPEYRDFWTRLGRGEVVGGEFKRIAKGGREVYLQATYNPIRDRDGKVKKVVKMASDVTAQVQLRMGVEKVLREVGESSTALSAAARQLTATS